MVHRFGAMKMEICGMHLCILSIWQKNCQAHWSDVTTALTAQTAHSVWHVFRAPTVITVLTKKTEQGCAANKSTATKKIGNSVPVFLFRPITSAQKNRKTFLPIFLLCIFSAVQGHAHGTVQLPLRQRGCE